MAFGHFAGGIAEGFNTSRELGLRERALGIQERALQAEQQRALAGEVDKSIAGTMEIIQNTIKGVQENAPAMDDLDVYAQAIQSIESQGSGGYTAVGPTHPTQGRPLGAYQVMESNLPSWSQEVLGRVVTPDEFLANPQLQDQIFKAKFGQYIEQTGGSAADAASMWFTGKPQAEGANAEDALGTSGTEYVSKFLQAVNQVPQQRVAKVVEPLLKSVEALAAKAGKDPSIYRKSVDATIAATPTNAEKAIAAGQAAGRQKIAETNTLITAGISAADARATAGIKDEAEPGQTPALAGKDAVEVEDKLRADYISLTKDFTVVRDGFQRIQQAFQNPSAESGISDVALTFGLMKMLDPTSTVRESETATVEKAPGVPAQLMNLHNALLKGATLTPGVRQDILNLATKLYEAKQGQQNKIVSQFTSIAQRSGVNPDNVVLDFSAAETPAPVTGTTSSGVGWTIEP